MEMLRAQVISEQLLYLRVPAPHYAPHTAAWLSTESNRTAKTKSDFPSDGCKSKSLLPQDLTALLSKEGHVSTFYLQQRRLRGLLRSVSPQGKDNSAFLVSSHGKAPLDRKHGEV